MVENKEEILGDLYCIKAGLSVISIEADKMYAMEKEVKEASNECAYQEAQLDMATQSIAGLRKKQFKDIGASVGSGLQVALKILLVVGCVLTAIIFGVLAFLNLKDGFKTDNLASDHQGMIGAISKGNVYLVIVIIAIVVLIVGWLILSKIRIGGKGYWTRNDALVLKERKAIKKESKEKLPALNERKATALEVYAKNKGYCIALAQDSYEFLRKNCTRFLHESDFQYVDLLIYYYETGRVDTLKEALNKVDEAVRFDTLIKTIERESGKICETVEKSVGALSYQMGAHFEKLGKQLDLQHRQTQTALENVSRGIRESAREMGNISDGQAVSNSLLKKINTSSTKLAEDTGYILRHVKTY